MSRRPRPSRRSHRGKRPWSNKTGDFSFQVGFSIPRVDESPWLWFKHPDLLLRNGG